MEIQTAILCDAATMAGGKLYIHGGQWDRIFVPSFPAVHPSMAIALVLRVEYNEALVDHPIMIRLMKEGQPVGPQAEAKMNVGHAPGSDPGDPTFVTQAVTFPLVQFPEAGVYEWVIEVGDSGTACSLRCVVKSISDMPGKGG